MYHVLIYDGKLVGVTPFDWVPLPGVSVVTYDEEIPDLNKVEWDEAEQCLVHKTVILTRLEFLSKFTLEERIAIRNSSDLVVKDILNLIEMVPYIDVTDKRTIDMINYLVGVGLINSSRIVEILV